MINIFVITITATSSYCGQVLSAPSRKEIDYAHSRRVLSIGSSSLTNIWYNSFVYVAMGANDYGVAAVPSNFATQNANTDLTMTYNVHLTSPAILACQGRLYEMRSPLGSSKNWIYLVAVGPSAIGNITAWTCVLQENGEITTDTGGYVKGIACVPKIDRGLYIDEDGNLTWWDGYTVNEQRVDYCLSYKISPPCHLGCSLPIGLVVLVCIGVKFLCMTFADLDRRREIFLTVGDAIASFLDRVDPLTATNCLMERGNKGRKKAVTTAFVNEYPWSSIFFKGRPMSQSAPPQPKKLSQVKRRWFTALPPPLFWITVFESLFILAVITFLCLVSDRLVGSYLTNVNQDGLSGWDKTLGSIYHTQLQPIRGVGFIGTILIMNCPQILISLICTIFNNALTRMLLAAKYSTYGLQRKPLRVSPTGD
ncbi:hypothetical protein AWENTII_007372 [Aspergillus wentii]